MKSLVPCIAALSICCANSKPPEERAAARGAGALVAEPATTAAVETAAEYGLTNYVDESTRKTGVVCVQVDGRDDPAKVIERLTPLAHRVSVDRSDCRAEPSAILSIGAPQVAGDRARVDVGVGLGSAAMLELERHDGAWQVVRVTSPWLSLR